MPRPPKRRCIGALPAVRSFGPLQAPGKAGPAGPAGDCITISVDEFEAVRLKDHEGMDQSECANMMGVSRGTFQRVLASARMKIAQAIVEGKCLGISGGAYCVARRHMFCRDCGCVVGRADPAGAADAADAGTPAVGPRVCPVCGGTDIDQADCRCVARLRHGRCPGRGSGRGNEAGRAGNIERSRRPYDVHQV